MKYPAALQDDIFLAVSQTASTIQTCRTWFIFALADLAMN
jgi:hypothetical protein